jgi:hypothetical protein
MGRMMKEFEPAAVEHVLPEMEGIGVVCGEGAPSPVPGFGEEALPSRS